MKANVTYKTVLVEGVSWPKTPESIVSADIAKERTLRGKVLVYLAAHPGALSGDICSAVKTTMPTLCVEMNKMLCAGKIRRSKKTKHGYRYEAIK